MSESIIAFEKERAATYDQRFQKLAPLKDVLHLISRQILEPLPENSWVLVVGAGTGSELIFLSEMFPSYRFTVVEPSRDMLDICREKVEQRGMSHRMIYHNGYLDDLVSESKFRAATSFLVSHFLTDPEQRLAFFRRIHDFLLADGVLITADLAHCGEDHDRLWEVWLRTLVDSGHTEEQMVEYRQAVANGVSFLSDQEMKALLRRAGFEAPALFLRTLLINAWFARRA